MIPLEKVVNNVEYSNIHSIKQALVGLELAFVEAEILKNKQRGLEVIKFAENLCKGFVAEEKKRNNKKDLVLPFWKNKAEKLHKYLMKRYNGWK